MGCWARRGHCNEGGYVKRARIYDDGRGGRSKRRGQMNCARRRAWITGVAPHLPHRVRTYQML